MARRKRGEKHPVNSVAASHKSAGTFEKRAAESDPSLWAICIALAVLTFSAYWGVANCGFVNLDDDAYVEFAPMVNQGLRPAAVAWAFTATHSNNWHPLTSLSHMLDCDLFGVRPGPMHIENLCWHVANTVLLFLLWKRMTGSRWRSAFIAALFALHPLHVESVAWISERKDVLSTFFVLLSLLAYVAYVNRKSEIRNPKFEAGSKLPEKDLNAESAKNAEERKAISRRLEVRNPKLRPRGSRLFYSVSLVLFSLALISKPMVVTLPVLLLLLDFWPLGRFKPSVSDGGALPRRRYELFVEKLPFFGLALGVGIVTLLVQIHTGAANYAARIGVAARLGNAVVSYARYLGKTIWPVRLSVFYHHPGSWPAWAVAAACLVVLVVSVIAWWQRQRRPWIAFGWLWFLLSLLPVIGLIQVGAQSMADRYTYIPLIGIFTIIAWTLHFDRCFTPKAEGADRMKRNRLLLRGSICVGILVLGLCFGLTRKQVSAWQDSVALYRHSIDAGEDNATVRYLLGSALQAGGASEAEVLAEYRRALELYPTYVNALTQLAVNALNHKDNEQCRKLIERTLELEPNNPALHKNLGAFYVRTGHPEQAIPQFQAALTLDPNYADAHHELAWIDLQQNKTEPAIQELRAVVRASPWDPQPHYELGDALAKSGRTDEARREFERAVWISPNYAQARERLNRMR